MDCEDGVVKKVEKCVERGGGILVCQEIQESGKQGTETVMEQDNNDMEGEGGVVKKGENRIGGGGGGGGGGGLCGGCHATANQ